MDVRQTLAMFWMHVYRCRAFITSSVFPVMLSCSLVQALMTVGWTYLDVRSALEVDKGGRVQGAVHIPYLIHSKTKNEAVRY